MSRTGGLVRGVGPALSGAGRDLRRTWTGRSWFWLGLAVVAAAMPFALSDAGASDAASWMCTVLAAIGLNVAVGQGGIPVLGQGAFMAVGAFTAAQLVARGGWDPVSAAVVAVVMSLGAGAVVGHVASRLQPAYVAVATWVVAWLAALALDAFPRLSGGAQGLVVANVPFRLGAGGPIVRMTPAIRFEVVLALVGLALLAFRTTAVNRPGLALAAVRQGPSAAAAVGVPAARLEWGAVVAGAGLAGLAGAMVVQIAGVADAASFGPLRSVELFVAVLLGGAGTTLGPVVGAAVLAALPRLSGWIGSGLGIERERFEPVLAAVLLLAALVLGRGGLVRLAAVTWRRLTGRPERDRGHRAGPRGADLPLARIPAAEGPARPGVVLAAESLVKRFGGVTAVDDAAIEVRPGEIHALIGPNGSGKSTTLRLLSGALRPDAGTVRLGHRDLTALGARERVAAGVARTLQHTVVFPELTALDHAEAGTEVRRSRSGALRTALATPQARREREVMRSRALAALDEVGLSGRAAVPAERLTSTEQRLLMIATALASEPRVLLLDEPTAGMSAADLDRLVPLLLRLRDRGLGLLLVEHNLRLVRRVAHTVTVLDAGAVIARGRPDDVASDPGVRLAYLGRATL